nr:hypothetical protein [uncultured Treponema sp.]
MKKPFLLVLIFLTGLLSFATAPEFTDGTVVSLSDYSDKLKDFIRVSNFSSLDNIEIEFFIYKESEWKSIGKISACPFGTEITLKTKEKFKKIEYVAYKTQIPDNKIIFVDIRNHDLMLYVLEKTNSIFGSFIPFRKINDTPSNGIYKFDTSEQRRHYEEYIRPVNAPDCIIMFLSPEYNSWDVFGYVKNKKFTAFYSEDIDDYEPYWIIQVIENHKFYNISAFAKNDDLYFKFIKAETEKDLIKDQNE